MNLSSAGKLVIIGLLVGLGVVLDLSGFLDARQILQSARDYNQHWWLILIIVLVQALMFTFALAGSLFLWIAAPLYPPLTATVILTIGSTLGGLGAYFFSRYLTDELKIKIEDSRVYKLLHGNSHFFTMFALRLFPGFPHSVVNYSAGLLRARLAAFIAASVCGIAIKTYIYARAIYGASSAMSVDMLFDVSVYGPLLVLSLLCMAGVYVNYRIKSRIQ